MFFKFKKLKNLEKVEIFLLVYNFSDCWTGD